LILAAGYATRLYPLTKKYPKPLLEVKGRPIIDHILEKLGAVDGLSEIYIVTNDKFIGHFRKWVKTAKSPAKITLVNDLTKSNADRLGAIGDINYTVKTKKVGEDLLVVGGDNLFSGSLQDFLLACRRNKASAGIGLFRLKRKKDATNYGVVRLDKNKRVVDFEEKPACPASNLVAMCLYYISKGHLRLISAYLKERKIKTDATGSYIAWLKDKTKVYGHVFRGSWFDIGDFKYLNAAKAKYLK
jgi:glucose-1-phosphate thymidylyltransferase